jgi:predicted AAA+ superfamily ATPase
MIQRDIHPTKTHSFFLFGPRGSGKTTFLQERFPTSKAVWIDLLNVALFDELVQDPMRLNARIQDPRVATLPVVIDEVQKIPRLLDIVHANIQRYKRQFILTGSSSRRLKQQGTNLLAGRAWVYQLYPFSTGEILSGNPEYSLKRMLEFGGLPEATLFQSESEVREYLSAYAGTYLEKEIQQEQWVRDLAPFRRFLSVAAQMNGKILNKTNIAREVGVHDVTVSHYFEILEDTLLGFILPAFHRSTRKAQRQAPKFYFIDPGIKRALDRTLTVELLPQTAAWGEAFEHWVLLEFVKKASYERKEWSFSYLRTKEDVEIDLIIDRPGERRVLIEIKSKSRVTAADAKALETLGADADPEAERYLLSSDPVEQVFGKTRAMPWQTGLRTVFNCSPSL